MCRAEAHRLYARKSIFDSLGIQLVAILNEQIDFEVRNRVAEEYLGPMKFHA